MDDGMSSSISPKPYLLLSATCDERLSRMIEIWMRNHLVRGSKCNTVETHNPQTNLQGTTNNVGLTFSVCWRHYTTGYN